MGVGSPQPAAAYAVEEARHVMEGPVDEDEWVDVTLRRPRTTTLSAVEQTQYILELHHRISPKLRALEIPP